MIEKFDFISIVRNADPQMKFNEKFITYTKEYHGQQRPTEAATGIYPTILWKKSVFEFYSFICLFVLLIISCSQIID